MARSDYGRYDDARYKRYGTNLRIDEKVPRRGLEYEYGRRYWGNPEYRQRDESEYERGFIDRAGDEVLSWLGDEDAERRRRIDALEKERSNRQDQQSEYQRRNINRGDLQTRSHAVAKDVMTRSVVCVSPGDTAKRAARLMGECDCGSLPVVDRNGRVIGMVTDRDIVVRVVGRGMNANDAFVYDCMTDEVFACHEYDTIESCLHLMAHHQIRRLPIVDNFDRVVGIVSQSDLALHAADNPVARERYAIANMLSEVSEPTQESYQH